jgi:hypothetical protein
VLVVGLQVIMVDIEVVAVEVCWWNRSNFCKFNCFNSNRFNKCQRWCWWKWGNQCSWRWWWWWWWKWRGNHSCLQIYFRNIPRSGNGLCWRGKRTQRSRGKCISNRWNRWGNWWQFTHTKYNIWQQHK